MGLKMLTSIQLLIVINLIGVISCSGRGVFFRFGSSSSGGGANNETQAEPIEAIFLEDTSGMQTARLGFQNTSNMTVLNYNMKYYQQTVLRAHNDTDLPAYWVDLNDENEFNTSTYPVTVDHVLSRNYLHSRVIWLKFKFPFYGHMIDRVLVTNMGFVYVGTLLNPYVSKAQYIAPLMADFDVTLSPNSSVKYVDNSTHFICTWERLLLTNLQTLGEYTFQLVVGIDGKIVFNYKSIPSMNITKPTETTVKVGVSDAFMDYHLYLNYFNTDSYDLITEYGLIQVQPVNVKSGNSIVFFMLKNCFQLTSCHECMRGTPNFNCIWCSALERCADAFTIKEAEWVHSACPVTYKGQSMATTCANASAHIKTELDLRPDWIGSEAEIHRSMIKFIEDENAIEMGNSE